MSVVSLELCPVCVAVTVVQVGIVWVPMHYGHVAVPMRVRLAGRCVCRVFVLMVRVVLVPMLMFNRFVNVVMLVPL